jgi:RNA polymerase sigma factor (sigma-70 family)
MASSQPEPTRHRGHPTSVSRAPESAGRAAEPMSRPRRPRPAPGTVNPVGHRTTRVAATGRPDPVPASHGSTRHPVRRAAQGDQQAWNVVVRQYSGLLWSVTREFRLTDAQAADAVQTTWLRLVEDPGAMGRPERFAGWLRTTARRTCLETVRGAGRERPSEPHERSGVTADHAPDRSVTDPEAHVLRQERMDLVRRAVQQLAEPDRQLLELLVVSPPLSYEEIGARLGVPVEGIEPSRTRLLDRLRTALAPADL